MVTLDVENQNDELVYLPDFCFTRSRISSSTLFKLNLGYNQHLEFSVNSLCFREQIAATTTETTATNQSSNPSLRQSKNKLSNNEFNHYLDLTLSAMTLNRTNRCVLKKLTKFFRRVRIFVVEDYKSRNNNNNNDDKKQIFNEKKQQNRYNKVLLSKMNSKVNNAICKCDFRLFLARNNVIIKDFCPRFKTYCADKTGYPPDDCSTNDQCL